MTTDALTVLRERFTYVSDDYRQAFIDGWDAAIEALDAARSEKAPGPALDVEALRRAIIQSGIYIDALSSTEAGRLREALERLVASVATIETVDDDGEVASFWCVPPEPLELARAALENEAEHE